MIENTHPARNERRVYGYLTGSTNDARPQTGGTRSVIAARRTETDMNPDRQTFGGRPPRLAELGAIAVRPDPSDDGALQKTKNAAGRWGLQPALERGPTSRQSHGGHVLRQSSWIVSEPVVRVPAPARQPQEKRRSSLSYPALPGRTGNVWRTWTKILFNLTPPRGTRPGRSPHHRRQLGARRHPDPRGRGVRRLLLQTPSPAHARNVF